MALVSPQSNPLTNSRLLSLLIKHTHIAAPRIQSVQGTPCTENKNLSPTAPFTPIPLTKQRQQRNNTSSGAPSSIAIKITQSSEGRCVTERQDNKETDAHTFTHRCHSITHQLEEDDQDDDDEEEEREYSREQSLSASCPRSATVCRIMTLE